jgi:hypothetical protein
MNVKPFYRLKASGISVSPSVFGPAISGPAFFILYFRMKNKIGLCFTHNHK